MAEPGPTERTRLVIEIERDDPIEGTLREPRQHEAPFRGWLAFAAVIDAALKADVDPSPPDGAAQR